MPTDSLTRLADVIPGYLKELGVEAWTKSDPSSPAGLPAVARRAKAGARPQGQSSRHSSTSMPTSEAGRLSRGLHHRVPEATRLHLDRTFEAVEGA